MTFLCQQLQLTDALDPARLPAPLQAHLDDCPACRAWWSSQQGLQQRLRELPVAAFPAELESRLRLRYRPAAGQRLRPWAPLALAASAVLAVMLLRIPAPGTVPVNPSNLIVAEAPYTVHLRLESPRDLEAVTLRLELPPGVELVDYPGTQVLEWRTHLHQGTQWLSLPVRGRSAQPLVATLQHRQSTRRFEALLDAVDRSGGHPLSHQSEVPRHA